MTDEERFEVVLEDLRRLMLALGDLASHVTLVGGQVVALEARVRKGSSVIDVETPTGVRIGRGYSLEPDLLFDVDAAPYIERLPEVMRQCEFQRLRDCRWGKSVAGVDVLVDLFKPEEADAANVPTGMTSLPGGSLAVARSRPIEVRLESGPLSIAVPDPLAYLSMKLKARRLRPEANKDAFDIYAYVTLLSPEAVSAALGRVADGREVRAELAALFLSDDAPGLTDVLAYAGQLEGLDRELVVRDVRDSFEIVCRSPSS